MNLLLTDEWFEVEGDCHEHLKRRFELIRAQSTVRRDLIRFYLSLFYDRAFAGFESGAGIEELFESFRSRLNENVIQRIGLSTVARLSKQRPKPSVLTDGADWSLQHKAKQFDKYIWGVMHKMQAYPLQRLSDVHMFVAGDGFIYVGSRKGRIFGEIAPPWELYVDTAEAKYGTPRTLYREQFFDRRWAMKIWPEHAEEIRACGHVGVDDAFNATGTPNADLIPVITAWRLPSWDGADDGRVTVCIDTCELSDPGSKWKRNRFPFARASYGIAPEGWWGISGVGALVGQQLELNKTLIARQSAMHLLSAPFFLVEKGSQVIKSHLSNAIGRIVEFTGREPKVVTPSAVSPENFTHGDRIKSSMFQQSGFSEFASMGVKPAGLNSGKALRAYADMQDDNMQSTALAREQQMVDLAECILDEAEDIADSDEENSDASVLYVGATGTEKIDFADASIDRNAFVLKVQTASSLSTTLAGKLEDLEDMRSLGIVTDPVEMTELLQMPDLATASSRKLAMRELLLQCIEERMLVKGDAITPEPTWDLKLALDLCTKTRFRASMMTNVPEGRIDLLHAFEERCIYYLQQADGLTVEPPQPPTQTPPEGMPMPGELPPEIPPEAMQPVAPMPEASPNPGGIPGSM